jgi:outer membrane protein assembly factor BamE (lipoprotein component of BamABCDE complex)
MKSTKVRTLIITALILPLIGCLSAHQHYEQTHGAQERKMTVGTVQKEIRKGMSAADVAEALGSPNIVTTDSEGREVWIYDHSAAGWVPQITADRQVHNPRPNAHLLL